MWNVWMTESCLPCFIKMYLRFHSALATPVDCGSAKVSALLSTKLSLHFNLKRSWICFILPYKSFPEPGGCPIDSHQIPLNFVFSLSTLYGNFQKGSLFFQNSRCAFLLQKPRKLFLVCRIQSHAKENTNHCLHWDESGELSFFRIIRRYNWMSTETMSLTEKLKVCVKAHLRNWKRSRAFSLLTDMRVCVCWKSPGAETKKWWGDSRIDKLCLWNNIH